MVTTFRAKISKVDKVLHKKLNLEWREVMLSFSFLGWWRVFTVFYEISTRQGDDPTGSCFYVDPAQSAIVHLAGAARTTLM